MISALTELSSASRSLRPDVSAGHRTWGERGEGAFVPGQRQLEPEVRPSRLGSVDADETAHELDEAFADRKAQAGAAVSPRHRRVGLGEALE